MKGTHESLTANITLNGERLNAFLPRSGARQERPLFLLLFNIALEVLISVIRKEKEIKGMQIGKEEIVFIQIIWLCMQISQRIYKNTKRTNRGV